jgi:hypothetical protein
MKSSSNRILGDSIMFGKSFPGSFPVRFPPSVLVPCSYISQLETPVTLSECDIENGNRTGATPLAHSACRPLAPEVAPALSFKNTPGRRASDTADLKKVIEHAHSRQ